MSESLEGILQFVQIGTRLDLKLNALEYLLGMSRIEDGIKTILGIPSLVMHLLTLLDDRNVVVAESASLCLVNVTSIEKGAEVVLMADVNKDCPALQTPPQNVVHSVLRHILDEQSHIADQCCMILSNISRCSHLIEKVIDLIEESAVTIDRIIDVFTKIQYNKRAANLDHLASVFSNLTQSHRIRIKILDRNMCLIQKLLPFTGYANSVVRRCGIAGTLKNSCFETDHHEWLLGEKVKILPYLLLPLAGNEEFDNEDNDKLPNELQYLPENKVREEDPDIRCILIEAIIGLVAKRVNREFIRDKNTYVILRELHKWEKDKKVLVACENLVNILLRTEEEIGADNLKDVEVPDHLQESFKRMDEERPSDH